MGDPGAVTLVNMIGKGKGTDGQAGIGRVGWGGSNLLCIA